jgi:hypothetical protein
MDRNVDRRKPATSFSNGIRKIAPFLWRITAGCPPPQKAGPERSDLVQQRPHSMDSFPRSQPGAMLWCAALRRGRRRRNRSREDARKTASVLPRRGRHAHAGFCRRPARDGLKHGFSVERATSAAFLLFAGRARPSMIDLCRTCWSRHRRLM